MPGHFELVDAKPHGVRINLVDSAGKTLATSGAYEDMSAAAAAVMDIREEAATAHVVDCTKSAQRHS
ncbi:YegP family protein [Arthrobacter sp. M4]|uniref:YegP family protein n=1 Tax=Arthrobacter sp. M4 TaxID=218160 RepID=UPI001CDC2357|nr:YegP family protein [Arthrobacter sp. M4]